MSIPPYEPPKSAPSPGAANTLLCPKCAGVMKTYERNGIHLEQCDTCRGIFLDFGELESLTQMENRFAQAAPPPPPPPQQGYGSYDYGPGWGHRERALPQAGIRPAVLLQLVTLDAVGYMLRRMGSPRRSLGTSRSRPSGRRPLAAARRRDDSRPLVRRLRARKARAPAKGRRLVGSVRRRCGTTPGTWSSRRRV